MSFKIAFSKGFCQVNETLGYLTVFNLNKNRDVVYERKVRYSDDKKLYLNVCYPKDSGVRKLPVFVYIHGGGWVSARPENREAFVSKVAGKGFFTINVFYGLAPKYKHKDIIKNLYDALAWLVDNQEKYNFDLSRIFVGGESAGAHLSAVLGAVSIDEGLKAAFDLNPKSKDMKFKGLLLNCGIFDMDAAAKSRFPLISAYLEAYSGMKVPEMKDDPYAKTMSPERYVTSAFPPSYIYTAKADRLRYGGMDMVHTLKKNDVKCGHYHADRGIAVHAFAVAQALKISREALSESMDFFMDILAESYKEDLAEKAEPTEAVDAVVNV